TYRQIMEDQIREWGLFRRALRKDKQNLFDGMMFRIRSLASAASYQASIDPTEMMFLCILLDQERELQELKRENGNHINPTIEKN
ncbi:MAG: hypothetical protein QF448_08310, partial [Candidatus Thalassarchaeaceae archaeon]|nr:hypothetical protein [Candidatus Thalassarchaeaceae archaeon]